MFDTIWYDYQQYIMYVATNTIYTDDDCDKSIQQANWK